MRRFLLVLGSTIALAACGSSGGGGGDGSSGTGKGSDNFVAQVQRLSATMPEDTEPNDVDAIVATAPEKAEPVNIR